MSAILDEVVAIVNRLEEFRRTVVVHPDDLWRVHRAFVERGLNEVVEISPSRFVEVGTALVMASGVFTVAEPVQSVEPAEVTP